MLGRSRSCALRPTGSTLAGRLGTDPMLNSTADSLRRPPSDHRHFQLSLPTTPELTRKLRISEFAGFKLEPDKHTSNKRPNLPVTRARQPPAACSTPAVPNPAVALRRPI